jgi:hypothetical protein
VKLKQGKKSQGNPSSSADRLPPSSVGVIRADEAYTLEEFKRRVGKKDAAFRSSRRAGLRVLQEGKQRYVLGRDWIDYLLKTAGHPDGAEGCGHA